MKFKLTVEVEIQQNYLYPEMIGEDQRRALQTHIVKQLDKATKNVVKGNLEKLYVSSHSVEIVE